MLGCFQAVFALTTARLITDGQRLFINERNMCAEFKVWKRPDFMDDAAECLAYGLAISIYVVLCMC